MLPVTLHRPTHHNQCPVTNRKCSGLPSLIVADPKLPLRTQRQRSNHFPHLRLVIRMPAHTVLTRPITVAQTVIVMPRHRLHSPPQPLQLLQPRQCPIIPTRIPITHPRITIRRNQPRLQMPEDPRQLRPLTSLQQNPQTPIRLSHRQKCRFIQQPATLTQIQSLKTRCHRCHLAVQAQTSKKPCLCPQKPSNVAQIPPEIDTNPKGRYADHRLLSQIV